MFRPLGLLLASLLLALAPATPAPGSALYHLTDLSAREAATLNNRGEVAYRIGRYDSREGGLYRSLQPGADDIRYTMPGSSAPNVYGHFNMGEDGALYGFRTGEFTLADGGVAWTLEAIRMSPEGVVTRVGPAGVGSTAVGANASGLVVGRHWTSGGYGQVFVHHPASGTAPARTEDLKSLGGTSATPTAPNAAGQFLADVAFGPGTPPSAGTVLVQPDGTVTRIAIPDGYARARLTALNDLGVAVGDATREGASWGEPMTWKEGTWTPLAAPDRPGIKAFAVTDLSNSGDMLVDTSLGQFVVREGHWYKLDELFDDPESRWELLRASAINDLGQILAEGIVQWGEGRNRHTSTVLLTPKSLAAPVPPAAVPEPAALAGFLALATLLARRRRPDRPVAAR
jgi:hypothetical protein